MALQLINTGTSANAGNGDTLRSAFSKVNANFLEIQNSLTNITVVNTGTGTGASSLNELTDVSISSISTGQVLKFNGTEWINSNSVNNGVGGTFAYYPQNGDVVAGLSSMSWSEIGQSLNIGNNFFTATSINYTVQEYFPSGEGKGFLFRQFHNENDSNNLSFIRSRGTSDSPLNVEKNDQIADLVFLSRFNNTNTINLVLTVEVVNTSTVESVADLIFFTNSGTGLIETVRLTSTGSWKTDKLDSHTTGSNITVYTGLIPSEDLVYDLGSTSSQWRSLYVGTGTIYIGGVPITINTLSNTLIVGSEPGIAPTTATTLATESFVINYVTTNGGSGLEIDGGFASTDYTAEIEIDGGAA